MKQIYKIKLCEACETKQVCDKQNNCTKDFIDWEEVYKNEVYKTGNTHSQCDLIYENKLRLFFIELKTKDWFDIQQNKYEYKKSILYKKISETFFDYKELYDTLEKQKIFVVLFSKMHIQHWEQIKYEIPAARIKTLLKRNIFPYFNGYNIADNSILISNEKIVLYADECTQIDTIIDGC